MTQTDITGQLYEKIFHRHDAETDVKIKIIKNDRPDVTEALKKTDGYCPCAIFQNEDTKCMCRAFREMDEGTCHCGLYTKVKR